MSPGLLCLNWADRGVQSQGWDGYILGALVTTQVLAGSGYVWRKIPGPAVTLLGSAVLMGVAAVRELF